MLWFLHDLELINSVDIRDLELALELSVFRSQGLTDERVDADELELDVVGVVRDPLSVFELFYFDGVDDVILILKTV